MKPPPPGCDVRPGARLGGQCMDGTFDCIALAHVDWRTCGHLNPMGRRPKRGWPHDQTVYWCDRCQTVQVGVVPFMAGACPQPRAGEGRCGTMLLRLSPSAAAKASMMG